MVYKLITGLDLGSSHLRLAVGQVQDNGEIQIIATVESLAEGINKGLINNLEEAVSSLSQALEKTERIVGRTIDHVCVGISGVHIISQNSRGVVAVANARGEIKEEDIGRVLEAAQTVALPPNYEILHVVPLNFIIDSQSGIKDPLGMTGIRLEVEAQVIQGISNQIKNITKCLYRTGLNVDDLVFSILATSEAVLDRRQKELGVAVLNLGATTTSLAVFEEGDLLLTKVLPIGSRHITNDLAIGLRVSIDLAETIKIIYGSALPEKNGKQEKINLKELDENLEEMVSKNDLAEIIEARCEEIFKLVDKELQSIKRSGKLPAGIVLTGGGAKLTGITEVAKRIFRLPISLGYAKKVDFAVEKSDDLSFTTAIGLVIWAKQLSDLAPKSKFSPKKIINRLFKKFF